jgi:hypothetical protein
MTALLMIESREDSGDSVDELTHPARRASFAETDMRECMVSCGEMSLLTRCHTMLSLMIGLVDTLGCPVWRGLQRLDPQWVVQSLRPDAESDGGERCSSPRR